MLPTRDALAELLTVKCVRALVREQAAGTRELEARLAKNSRNSSKPRHRTRRFRSPRPAHGASAGDASPETRRTILDHSAPGRCGRPCGGGGPERYLPLSSGLVAGRHPGLGRASPSGRCGHPSGDHLIIRLLKEPTPVAVRSAVPLPRGPTRAGAIRCLCLGAGSLYDAIPAVARPGTTERFEELAGIAINPETLQRRVATAVQTLQAPVAANPVGIDRGRNAPCRRDPGARRTDCMCSAPPDEGLLYAP